MAPQASWGIIDMPRGSLDTQQLMPGVGDFFPFSGVK